MAEYIERERLSKALKIWRNRIIKTYGKNDEYVRCLDSVLLDIDNIPAADVRPVVHGNWVDPFDCVCYRCTACDEYVNREVPDIPFAYCPNCGAKMDGDK